MNTIQTLYHGRLSTQPLCPECKEEVRQKSDDVTSLEKLLQNHLNEHGIVLFQQYIDTRMNCWPLPTKTALLAVSGWDLS